MQLWSLSPSIEEYWATWEHRTQGGKAIIPSFTYLYPATGESVQSASVETFKIRALCHLLLDWMPEVGLREALDSLRDALEFHGMAPQRALPPPLIRTPAALGRTTERLDFHAVED